ncbi:hypothetical protein [Metabacillus endolithicus]|uniref:Uncharacterized protein n=1 Tax=Metabacillus endolithicus TaxID=1535204 RepID=A0ABW5C626_9BACI|nr:hypothetical protein [Metabacillus endolithicus]UPG66242.1 hypothetical protein MVE64_26410 [Metabacillus endolithicus]
MKLIGSKTEQNIREQLIKSYKYLLNDKSNKKLLSVIESTFPNMKSAYIIDWIPEQGEDIYTVLINTETITKIEISRVDTNVKPVIESISVTNFRKSLSKIRQIKLAVAIDLAKNN